MDELGIAESAVEQGFAISSAVLTSLSLLAAFSSQTTKLGGAGGVLNFFDGSDPSILLSGVLFGAMWPFFFAGLTMSSLGIGAAKVVHEVRRQMRELMHPCNPGVTLRNCVIKASKGEEIPEEEDVEPDTDRLVALLVQSSAKATTVLGTCAVLPPVLIGFCFGPQVLMGVLAGAMASGCAVAMMMSTAGAASGSSMLLCEKLKIKKTEQGKACTVGASVGEAFKKASGPVLSVLIKLMCMVALTISPLMKNHGDSEGVEHSEAAWVVGLVLLILVALLPVFALDWLDPLA